MARTTPFKATFTTPTATGCREDAAEMARLEEEAAFEADVERREEWEREQARASGDRERQAQNECQDRVWNTEPYDAHAWWACYDLGDPELVP